MGGFIKKSILILSFLYFLSFSDENIEPNIRVEEGTIGTNCFPKIDLNLTFFYKVNFDSDKNTFEIQKEKITWSDHFYDDSFQYQNESQRKKMSQIGGDYEGFNNIHLFF